MDGDAAEGDADVADTMPQPQVAASQLRAGWRALRPDQFLLAYVATVVMAGTYTAYQISASTPDPVDFVSQPIRPGDYDAPVAVAAVAAVAAVPGAAEAKPAEPGATARIRAPVPSANTNVKAQKRASVRQRTVPKPKTTTGAPAPVARAPAAAPRGVQVAETPKAGRLHP